MFGVLPGGATVTTIFSPLGVEFDGSNDYMSRGAALTGTTDSDDWLVSAWFKPTSTSNGLFWSENVAGGDKPAMLHSTQKVVLQNYKDAGNYYYGRMDTQMGTGTWHHVLMTLGSSPYAGKAYIDDSSSFAVGGSAGSSFTTDNTGTNFTIGAAPGGSQKVTSAIAELFIIFGSTMDISLESNRRKFIDAAGKPVNLGSDGSLPTGSLPDVYCSVQPGDAASVFATNRGAGGSFSITGSLVLSSTNPGD